MPFITILFYEKSGLSLSEDSPVLAIVDMFAGNPLIAWAAH